MQNIANIQTGIELGGNKQMTIARKILVSMYMNLWCIGVYHLFHLRCVCKVSMDIRC